MHETFGWFQFVKKIGPQLRNDLPKLFRPLYNFRVSNELIDRLDVVLANRLDTEISVRARRGRAPPAGGAPLWALRFSATPKPTDLARGVAFEN